MLLGSVLVPARETWRIMDLLRETTNVIEPARAVAARLEFGLAVESAALEGYAFSGDSVQLTRYVAAAADDDRRLATIESLVRKLDADAIDRADAARNRLGEWREISRGLVQRLPDRAELALRMRAQRASYEQALRDVARLSSYLAAEGSARRELIHRSERLGLLVNASLVFIAVAAVIAVNALSRRERRLARILERRVDEELALREAAEALAAAFTFDDVTRQIANRALDATPARGTFVEQIGACAGEREQVAIVRASAGSDVPALGTTVPFPGSIAELALSCGEPVLVPNLARDPRPCAATDVTETGCSAIVVPLRHAEAPVGALFVLSAPGAPFGPEHLVAARTFGHLATLAYEKVRLLDEARGGRAELERIVKSRSRLMRGFSHDVKNPLGAADGYAELLTAGVYGVLSPEQNERVECIRRSLRVALALIDDLHQLARAELGRLELSVTPVDLGELARASGEEYEASAEASGLSLSVDQPPEPMVVATDRARVRQIVSNLLSNAIKYTPSGSIVLRVRRWPPHQLAPTNGWAAIDVTDSGPGIPPERWDTIFDEFIRLGTNEKPGAGLGLAISQRLAQALGGQITLQSEIGSGSIFTLWLPLHKAFEPAAAVAATVVPDITSTRAPVDYASVSPALTSMTDAVKAPADFCLVGSRRIDLPRIPHAAGRSRSS
jgi:signal transduction histidine kinase